MMDKRELRRTERQVRIWEAERDAGLELSSPFYHGDVPDPSKLTWALRWHREAASSMHTLSVAVRATLLVLAGWGTWIFWAVHSTRYAHGTTWSNQFAFSIFGGFFGSFILIGAIWCCASRTL